MTTKAERLAPVYKEANTLERSKNLWILHDGCTIGFCNDEETEIH